MTQLRLLLRQRSAQLGARGAALWQTTRAVLQRVKILRAGVQKLNRFISQRREILWILEGRERNSGEPLSLLFAGAIDNRNYIAHLVFGESGPKQNRARSGSQGCCRAPARRTDVTIWQLFGLMAREPAQIPRRRCSRFHAGWAAKGIYAPRRHSPSAVRT